MSSRSSSRSSKPASIAKSSSTPGSSLRLTSLTVISNVASRPASSRWRGSRRETSARPCAALAGAGPEQPLLEARDQVAGAELDELVAALAARERLRRGCSRALAASRVAVARRLGAAASRRSRSRRSRPAAAARSAVSRRARRSRMASISSLDLLVLDGGLAAGHLEALVVAELGLGQHADLDRELAAPGPAAAGRRDRAAGRRRARCRRWRSPREYQLGERVADGLLEHRLAADALDHQRRGHLAAAKARAASARARAAWPCAPGCPSTSAGGTCTCRRTRESPSSVRVVVRAALARWATIPCRPDESPPAPTGSQACWRPGCGRAPSGHLLGGALDFAGALARYRTRAAGGHRTLEDPSLRVRPPPHAWECSAAITALTAAAARRRRRSPSRGAARAPSRSRSRSGEPRRS